MKKATPFAEIEPVESPQDALTAIVRDGAQKMLAAALEHEVADYLAQHADARDVSGHRLVVRNGHGREREIQTGVGSVPLLGAIRMSAGQRLYAGRIGGNVSSSS